MLTDKELVIFGAFGTEYEKELTFQDLKKHAKQRSNNAVLRALARFRIEGIISERKVGTTKLYKLVTSNERCFTYLALSFEDSLSVMTQKPVRDLLVALDAKLPLYAAAIFGSYAKGTFTKTSDLDLAVVVSTKKEEEIAKEIAYTVKNRSVFELDIHVITIADFSEMLRADYENLGKQIKEKHLPVRNPGGLYRVMYGQHH